MAAAVEPVAVVAVVVVGSSDVVAGLQSCIEVHWAGVIGRVVVVGDLVED